MEITWVKCRDNFGQFRHGKGENDILNVRKITVDIDEDADRLHRVAGRYTVGEDDIGSSHGFAESRGALLAAANVGLAQSVARRGTPLPDSVVFLFPDIAIIWEQTAA